MAGYLQASEEQKSWLQNAYEWLRKYDRSYSKEHNFPISIKLTTEKPDGTQALLPGVTPGVHGSPAGPFYIRRIRISSGSPLLDICRKNGYDIEYQKNFDGTNDSTTKIVSFPCKVPENTPIAKNFSYSDQLDVVRRVQREWSDNSVSCTIYYKREDIKDIKEYLEEYFRNEIKTISFLLYNDHGFVQAPYEDITKEEYNQMIAKTTPITSVEVNEDDFETSDCSNGVCPIR
jgi:ribonucleoside-diphosphate reductase alpha chain